MSQADDFAQMMGVAQPAAPSSSFSVAGQPPQDRRKQSIEFWTEKGVPFHVAEGITDAFGGESGLNPQAFNPAGGGQGALGLGQWRGPRQAKLREQPNYQDLGTQLGFAYGEVTGGDPIASAHWDEIKNAPDRATAKSLWSRYFERPGSPSMADKSMISDDSIAFSLKQPNSRTVEGNIYELLSLLPEADEKTAAGKSKGNSLRESVLGRGYQIMDLPSIDVTVDKSGRAKITDYDGLHRLELLASMGVNAVPVRISGVPEGTEIKEIEGLRGGVQPFNFAPVQLPKPKVTAPSGLERFGMGAQDPIVGAAQLAGHARMVDPAAAAYLPPEVLNEISTGQGAASFDKAVQEREAAYERGREAGGQAGTDWARLAGNVAATAPLMVAAPAAGAGLGGAAVAGAVGGATGSALAPVTSGNFLAEKAKQIGEGAALGAGLGGVGNALARGVAPTILPAAQRLLDQGVRLLPGQMRGGALKSLEEVSTSVPFSGAAVAGAQRRAVEDWNRAMYDKVLRPLGEHYLGKDVGTKGLATVKKKLSDAYEVLKPKIHFKADAQYENEVAELKDLVFGLPGDLSTAFNNIVSRVNKMMGSSKYMDGPTFKEVESELTELVRDWKNPQNSPLERKVGDAVKSLLGSLRANLERVNPAERDALRRLNTAWAGYMRLRDAGTRRVNSSGVFSPSDVLMAERKLGGRPSFADGEGLLQKEATDAMEVMGNRYPDSGTGRRYATLGEVASTFHMPFTNPALFAAMVGGHAAHALAYSSPGTNFLRTMAGHGFPMVRNMLARGTRVGINALAPGAGMAVNPLAMQYTVAPQQAR